ncbi:hypothetical protein A2363_02920 [Candidatus Gottesmanbacteria bacterium RIFOXYB1_FULL_47_11]|uniref:Uncharacterized protein n=1 Tax=Candidatus Gottesmanbacteria bacterium RIFOXYB1_FULL_47_11 TaxID=1798401 RepID=A0A1F6BCY1_9BACT|nr:MAG: hypothetical protein A2363_02920 [Candidatus Gottesmanbacteria bacterium RIFOXYB1_FULL_47_11]
MIQPEKQSEYILPAGAELVDWMGADSDVYRMKDGRRVLKVYTHYTPEQIGKYQEFMRCAADWTAGHPVAWEAKVNKRHYRFSIGRVVKIDRIDQIAGSSTLPPFHWYTATESEFIFGPNGQDFNNPDASFERKLKGLQGPEKARLCRLKVDSSYDGSPIVPQLIVAQKALSGDLNRALGVEGIEIIEYNMKFRMPADGVVSCIVTDICPNIRKLRSTG